jgi:DNA-binding MarR family transcriptional regulator
MLVGVEGADEPRWLDEDQQETWIAFATMMVRLPAALDAQLQRDAGISHFEYQVLAGLSMAAGRTLRMSTLAAFTAGSLSRLSQVVGRLERRGWIRRTPDPDDGRYTLAILTDAGWDKVVATAPAHVAEVRRVLFEPLTRTQQRHLRDVGHRVVRAIDPDDTCPRGVETVDVHHRRSGGGRPRSGKEPQARIEK